MDTPSTVVVESGIAGSLPYDTDTSTMQNGTHCNGSNLFEIRTC